PPGWAGSGRPRCSATSGPFPRSCSATSRSTPTMSGGRRPACSRSRLCLPWSDRGSTGAGSSACSAGLDRRDDAEPPSAAERIALVEKGEPGPCDRRLDVVGEVPLEVDQPEATAELQHPRLLG